MIKALKVFNANSPNEVVHTSFVEGEVPPVGEKFALFPYHDASSRSVTVTVESHDYFGSCRDKTLKIGLNIQCSVSREDFEYLSNAPDWIRSP